MVRLLREQGKQRETTLLSPSQLVRETTATSSRSTDKQAMLRPMCRVLRHLPFRVVPLFMTSLKFSTSIVRATIIPCATIMPLWLTIAQIVTMSTLRGRVRADRRHQSSCRQPFDYFCVARRRHSTTFGLRDVKDREFLRVPVQVQIRLLYLRVPSYVIQSSQITYGLPPVCAIQVFLRSFLRKMNKFHHQASFHFLSLGRLSPLEGDSASSSSVSTPSHYFAVKRLVPALNLRAARTSGSTLRLTGNKISTNYPSVLSSLRQSTVSDYS